jgi:hypothetical protein
MVAHCHARGVLGPDLKLEYVLLSADGYLLVAGGVLATDEDWFATRAGTAT